MSAKHPVIVVTGSSGVGTTTVKNAFEHIFFREKINPLVVEGDSYHRYERAAMKAAIEAQPNLDLKQAMVDQLMVEGNCVAGVRDQTGFGYQASMVILATGTF